jgi:hypothetical protein
MLRDIVSCTLATRLYGVKQKTLNPNILCHENYKPCI